MKPLNLIYASDCSVSGEESLGHSALGSSEGAEGWFQRRDAAEGGKEYMVFVRSGLGSGLKRRFRIKH